MMKDTQNNCECEEMSCKKGCTKNHTHKGFWCEKCHPERYTQNNNVETRCKVCRNINTGKRCCGTVPDNNVEGWEKNFDENYAPIDGTGWKYGAPSPQSLKAFIRNLLASQTADIVGRIEKEWKLALKKRDGTTQGLINTIEKFDTAINLIKQ